MRVGSTINGKRRDEAASNTGTCIDAAAQVSKTSAANTGAHCTYYTHWRHQLYGALSHMPPRLCKFVDKFLSIIVRVQHQGIYSSTNNTEVSKVVAWWRSGQGVGLATESRRFDSRPLRST